MTAIHEIQQVLWLETPHGMAQALFIMDYGVHENTIWICANEKTGELKHYNSEQLKVACNYTVGVNLPTRQHSQG